ncbi:MAG: hypothetical protein ACRD2X_23990, partial [Vicinamibacteraceae bacterium]
MQRFGSPLAFASGSVASAVIALTAMSLHGQSSPRDNAFHVCVGKDRVLRLVETDAPCPEGQERLRLREADVPDVEPPKDTDTKKDKKPPAKEPKPTSSKVQAPFEVVDYHGRTILRVDTGLGNAGSRGIGVYDTTGRPVAFVLAESHGHGVLRAESANGRMATSLAAADAVAGLRVREDNRIRVDVGKSDSGSYAARFYASGKEPMAALGLSADGTSLVMVSNGTQPLAAMGARGNKGLIQLTNASGVNMASLSEGTKGGGVLQLTDAAGTTMVEAGNDGGVG